MKGTKLNYHRLNGISILWIQLLQYCDVNGQKPTGIGFDFYATVITLNENMEIEVIHQDYDVAQ